jgi:hypothetical protein
MANKPNNPELWSRAKSLAKQKFDVYPCVPMESQALTKEGWKYYHELKVGENILAYNQETNKNEWTPIIALQFFENAPLVRLFKSQTNFDVKCTPNHKWVLAESNSKYPDNLVEAKDITKHMIIKTSAELSDNGNGLDLNTFFKKDSWVENVLKMSVPQIQSYFASGIVYDGNDKGLSKKEDKQTYGFSQKEKDHGLAMEIAAVLLGYRVCSVNKKHNPTITSWTFIRRNKENTNNLHKEDAGIADVWCPTTKFGTWVMKQNNYITITGNSAYANGWAAKWYKSKGGTWRKAQDGMDLMREGGINNPGFKALPKDVQQNIIDNMKDGGRLPNYKSGMKGTGAQPQQSIKKRNSIKPSSLMRFGGNTKIEHGSAYYQDGDSIINSKPVPMIDDTKYYDKEGNIDMEGVRNEAKRINSKVVRTKTGAVLYFDDNYLLEHADDGSRLNNVTEPKSKDKLYKAQDGVDSRMIQARPFVNQKPLHVEDVRDYLVGYDDGRIEFDYDMLRDKAKELGVDKIRINDEEGSIFGFDPKNNYKIIYKNTSGDPERIPGQYKLQQGGRLIKTEDPDGEMALGQIRSMHNNLYQLEELINADSELEPWVNSKLTLANDYLDVVADYMKYNPETEDGGEYMMTEDEYEEYQKGGGIPTRYKNMGFTRVGQKKAGDGIHKWKVLAKKGDKYKVVQGGWRGMQDYSQHGSEKRRNNFWNRMGGKDSAKAKDPFSPLYWHKKLGKWQEGGLVYNPNLPVDPVAASIFDTINQKENTMMRKGGYAGSTCMQCGGMLKYKMGGSCGCGKKFKYGRGGSTCGCKMCDCGNNVNEDFKLIHESDVLHPADSKRLATKNYSGDPTVGFMYTKTINKTIKR